MKIITNQSKQSSPSLVDTAVPIKSKPSVPHSPQSYSFPLMLRRRQSLNMMGTLIKPKRKN